MEEELRKLSRQIRRTRVGGVLGLGLLGASMAGCLYHMKVMHHNAFSEIYAKHKTKMEERRLKTEECPVPRFNWRDYDLRRVVWRSKWPGQSEPMKPPQTKVETQPEEK